MTHATFEPDYVTMSLDENQGDEKIDKLQEQVECIRDHLVFDEDSEETIAIVQGGFTHNVIGMSLSAINAEFGKDLTNSILVGLGLENVGWSVA
jgi:hypothetical protein